MKFLFLPLLLVAFGFALFMFNTYTSSPGFTTAEYAEEFYRNAPTCYGVSILLNREATYADAPGRSLCVGLLR